MRRRCIVVDERDNVATAIMDLGKGESVETPRGRIALLGEIRYGHKFALEDIPVGGYVVKYGEQIGRATVGIAAGSHVHVHNVEDIVDEVRKR